MDKKKELENIGLYYRDENTSSSRFAYLDGYWYHKSINNIAFSVSSKLDNDLITAYTHEYTHENFERIITMNLEQLKIFINLLEECSKNNINKINE